jgi:acyl carrier protein
MSETTTSVNDRIRTVISDITGIEGMKGDSHFIENEGIDSLEHTEILIELEKEFNVRIPDDDGIGLMTIDSISEYLEREHAIL